MGKFRNTVRFEIQGLPVSVNNAIRFAGKRTYKTKQFKQWEELVFYCTKEQTINKSEWYGVEVLCHFPLYCKNGSIRRKDIDDLLKYAIDTTLERVVDSEGNPIDDKCILEGSFAKIDSEQEKTEIIFYTID
jgi:Holliday junction resolvase RusA-like endonuclease